LRRAFSRASGRRFAAGVAALLLTAPVVSHATPIVFRIFNLGQTTAYVVQRNSRTVATEATSSEGVFSERVDASKGDQIVLVPDIDLAPPLPPTLSSVSSTNPGCAHIAWTPSGDPTVIGYKISYGVLSVNMGQMEDYQYSMEVGPVSSYDACSLAGATYYFAVQAINYVGQTSAYSEERSVQLVTAAVLISRFDAHAGDAGVRLSWHVVSDENIAGYLVYRRVAGASEKLLINTPLPSNSTTYLDTDVRNGTSYTYVLAALRDDGSEIRSIPASATTPSLTLALRANSPNPFRAQTRIPFTVDATARVTLRIYDVTGALVTTLLDGPLAEGEHDVNWNGMDASGRRVASGAYFCTLTSGKRMQSRKMVLIR
jgi:FlgD Ig-like domain